MHPPGLVEEQARVRRHGSVVAEDVLERRTLAPGGWAAWLGWASCWGSPIRTRFRAAPATARMLASDLAGLVDEQRVHASLELLARPEPGRSGPYVQVAVP